MLVKISWNGKNSRFLTFIFNFYHHMIKMTGTPKKMQGVPSNKRIVYRSRCYGLKHQRERSERRKGPPPRLPASARLHCLHDHQYALSRSPLPRQHCILFLALPTRFHARSKDVRSIRDRDPNIIFGSALRKRRGERKKAKVKRLESF